MLQFILGRASSGKSYEICRRIADCVKQGCEPVLIIPEQFSFESEKRILSLLGDSGAQKVKVLSFSRLCDEVESIAGGGAVGELSDSDKIILMTTAIKNVRGGLKYFDRYSLSPGFSKKMLNTVGEFILNSVTGEDISSAIESIGDGVLGRKLSDTHLIFTEYKRLISEKLSGYEDRLTNLYRVLENFGYFEGKHVFIDSFGGFTGQQYKIIDRILSQSACTVVSLCDSAQKTGDFSIFANTRKAKKRISEMAERHGVEIVPDMCLPGGKHVSQGMAAVEEYMCLGKTDKQAGDALKVCRAQTAYDEARFVARNIRRIVRENGARYGDFVVIARNVDDYEQVMSLAFSKNGIHFFSDRRLPLASFPPASAALAAMELSGKMTTEKLFRFHKSGVSFLSEEEINELENYVYVWNIDGAAWKNAWTMDPAGLDNKKLPKDELEGKIERINLLRKKALSPVTLFCDSFKGTPRDMAKAVVTLLEGAADEFLNISNNCSRSGKAELSEGIVTAYAKVMKILDSMVNCLDNTASPQEFRDVFRNCVSIESIGVIPQMIDEVLFGSAERIQPARPQYVFIMGANAGVFPRAPQANGIFAVSEVGKLIKLGIDIPDCSVYSAIDEDLLVYNCVCCANKQVFISFNDKSGEPAHFVRKLADRFSLNIESEPDKLGNGNLPETADDTFSSLCRSRRKSNDFETMKSALADLPEYGGRINLIAGNDKRPGFNIRSELAKKLIGRKIPFSASKFDAYSKCPFNYFCKYALGVKSVEPVSFSSMQSGTLVHYVLQRFVEEIKDKIDGFSADKTDELIERLVNEYLDSFRGYREAETPHLKIMVYQMTMTLKYLGARLLSEFKQSDFKPEKCELTIGDDGDIPPLELEIDGETSLELTGAVDRLDRYSSYVRVIDYKSGGRKFRIPDILVGQNMQMLIYLYAVCSDEKYGGEPGGIFYMKASMPDEDKPAGRRMNGFMPETQELITAMDKSGCGEYIPQSSPKSRKTGATQEDFRDIFEFVELKLKQAGRDIAAGRFCANPVDGLDKDACEYCEFSSICRIENEKPKKAESRKASEVISEIKRQVKQDVATLD